MDKKVSKKMLINTVHPEEARIAIVHDGRLMELNIEITGKEQLKGNIYKGVVVRIEPSLQAAFVDIGRAKPGFLQMGELHPDYWQWRDDIPEEQRKRRPRIQEVLRRGQELMVQVEKDERDHKGSALTSYVSLPGRYMVIMPGGDAKGISRKVEQEGERKKLKEIVAEMNIPEGIGYIIRTEAVGRTAEEISKDFENLVELYENIKQRAAEIKGAGEVYKDKGLICRFIRDYFSDDIDEVLVDSKDAYRDAKEYFRQVMPKCEKLVKLHKEKRPIFSRFQLEEQIDQIYEKRVMLPSGGYIIIEPTEALVTVDVNSGKSSGERGIEETAHKTNMEAVEETARQLRLRDLGGLIVIDCIDMRENKHNIEVERTLKSALKMDKARTNVGRISEFGLLEMSRQRIAKTLNDAIHLECPHCEGRGKVKSVEAMAVSFLRKVHGAAAKGTVAEVHGGLPLDVAYYLLNRKKRELVQIENDYEITVTVKGKTSFLLNQLELDITRREKPRIEETVELQNTEQNSIPTIIKEEVVDAVEITESIEVLETTNATTAVDVLESDGIKKRKRRRKKKKSVAILEIVPEITEVSENIETVTTAEVLDQDDYAELLDQPLVLDDSQVAAKKKRKRRRKKPVRKPDEEQTDGVTEQLVPDIAVEIQEMPETSVAPPEAITEEQIVAGDSPVEKPVASKRKRPPRKRKPVDNKTIDVEKVEETPETVKIVEMPTIVEISETTKTTVKPKKAVNKKQVLSDEIPTSEIKEDVIIKKKSVPRIRKQKTADVMTELPAEDIVVTAEKNTKPNPRARKKSEPKTKEN